MGGVLGKSGAVAFIARRRYWGAADAQIVIGAWRRSRESQTRFAQRYGLDPKRIGRWASRLARDEADGGASTGVRFHPVRLVPTVGRAVDETATIEIVLGDGRTLRVPPGFAAADLARAVTVLTTLAGER